MDDEKDNHSNNGKKASLTWDLAVNSKHIQYTNENHTATATTTQYIARGPFWRSGRHIVNIKLHKSECTGIGIVDKAFTIAKRQTDGASIGQDTHSYGLWSGTAYHWCCHNWSYQTKKNLLPENPGMKTGDIVTIDVDLDKKILNWAINGQYLAVNDIATNIPNQVAIAAVFWIKGDSAEIIQYQTNQPNPLK
eukprot:127743_1